MGDVEHGDALLVAELAHQVEHADPDRDVEHGRGFVGEDDLWFDGERPGDRDPLALPAGELVRVGVEHVGGQPDRGHELSSAWPARVRRRRPCRGTQGRSRKCPTRWTGFSEPKGSWKTICSRAR